VPSNRAAGLLAVALVFAGCTATQGNPYPSKTAMETAEREAMAWNPEAVLISAGAIEARDAELLVAKEDLELEAETLRRDDARPGDGHARAWIYVYQDPAGGPALRVVVSPDGEVLWKDGQARRLLAHPLDQGQWRLDAPEAWQMARDGLPPFQRPAEDLWGAMQWVGMLKGFDHPVWVLIWMPAPPPGEPDAQVAVVDALDGTVYDATAFFATFLLPPESGGIEASLDALRPSNTHDVTIKGLNSFMVVALAFQPGTPPGQRVSLQVTGPDGRVATLEAQATAAGSSPAHVAIELPDRGLHHVMVTLDPPGPSGIAASYDLSWCTEGFDFGFTFSFPVIGPDRHEACDFI